MHWIISKNSFGRFLNFLLCERSKYRTFHSFAICTFMFPSIYFSIHPFLSHLRYFKSSSSENNEKILILNKSLSNTPIAMQTDRNFLFLSIYFSIFFYIWSILLLYRNRMETSTISENGRGKRWGCTLLIFVGFDLISSGRDPYSPRF